MGAKRPFETHLLLLIMFYPLKISNWLNSLQMAQATSTKISVSTEPGQSVEYLTMDAHNTGSSNKEHWTPQAMCISPDGSHLVAVWHHRGIYWRTTKGKDCSKAFSPHSGDCYVDAAVSPDNEYIFLLERRGRIMALKISEDDIDRDMARVLLDLGESGLNSQSKKPSFIIHPTGQIAAVIGTGANMFEIGARLQLDGDPMDTRSDGIMTPEAIGK